MNKELTVNELRVGNIIDTYLGAPISESMEVTVTPKILFYFHNYPKTSYHPIPLTEEWLIKFGFEVIDTYLNEDLTVLVYGINITNCNNEEKLICDLWNMVFSIGDYSDDDYYVLNLPIKNVHQLQNLYFALTNTELKIKQDE